MGCATASAEQPDCSDLAPAKTVASQLACPHVGTIVRSEQSAFGILVAVALLTNPLPWIDS